MRLLATSVVTVLAMVVAACGGETGPATPAAPPLATGTSNSPAASTPTQVTSEPQSVPTETPTPSPTTKAADTCGAPANTLGLNFCRRGHLVQPPAPNAVCTVFRCIQNFDNGKGYLEQCNDGQVSMSGGRQGACSKHNGEKQPIYQD
jgi:hypothetical protein